MLKKEYKKRQLGIYEQMMLKYSYPIFCVACLYGLTRIPLVKSMEPTKIFTLCCIAVESSKGYSNNVWGNCFRSHFRASVADSDSLFFMLVCSYFYPHNDNLCIAEGRALHLPQDGAKAVLHLLGGTKVDHHQQDVTKEREVRASLALRLPNLKVLTLGLQRIRMPLISKG